MNNAQLSERIDAAVAEHNFSGVIAIRRQGAVLYERAAGYADRSNQVSNTLETRFGIASGTKTFTALAIGTLIAAQKLALSTKLRDCLTLDFPRYSPAITVEHLLTHTSGIPDYYDEEKFTDYDNFSVGVPWHHLKGPRDYLAVFPDEPMKFEPGARFSYSNGGYILLGVLIEELTGMRYQEYVEQAIFRPAGMDRSGYFALNRLPEKTALGYIEDEYGWRTNVYNLPIVGASDGGAFTCVRDLDRLWQAFLSYQLLPQELTERYITPWVTTSDERSDSFYGYGLWLLEQAPGAWRVSMVGNDGGVSFKSSVSRADNTQVTVMSNTTEGAWPVLRAIDQALSEAPA